MPKQAFQHRTTAIIAALVDRYGKDYCQQMPVRYCCYLDCKRCKELARKRLEERTDDSIWKG